MNRAATPTPADPRLLLALKDLLNEVRAVRSILESQVEQSRAPSHGATAVSDTKDAERDALMTAAELAEFLRIDQRTLREMRHSGTVPPPITIGRLPRWRRQDIDAWLAKGVRK